MVCWFKGAPVVKCGPDKIEVSAVTAKPFQGVVYIKNWRKSEGCFHQYKNESTIQDPSLGIDLRDLGRCGIEMKRSVGKGAG